MGSDVKQLELSLTRPFRRAVELYAEGAVLDAIACERDRQHGKWGEQNHPDIQPDCDPDVVASCLAEARRREQNVKECCEIDARNGWSNWHAILSEEFTEAEVRALEGDQKRLREELIQVAAVAVAWIECIDRRKK